MKRRNLILGLLFVAAMGTAHARQSGKVYRIAYVHSVHPAAQLTEANGSPTTIAVLKELRRLGYVLGVLCLSQSVETWPSNGSSPVDLTIVRPEKRTAWTL